MTAKVVRSTGSDVVATSQLESVAVMATFGHGQIERHRAPVEQVAQHDRNAEASHDADQRRIALPGRLDRAPPEQRCLQALPADREARGEHQRHATERQCGVEAPRAAAL